MTNSIAIVDNIKQEEETEDEKVLDQFTVIDFVGDIKHEPERHFVFIMPDDPEIDEVKEVKIVLRKFDRNWKTNSAMMFETFFVCGKCDFAAKKSRDLKRHKKSCKIPQKCEKCFLKSKSEIVRECGMCDLKFNCSNCKTKHLNQVHIKGSSWYCTKCDYKSLSKKYLRSHFQTHVKKFSCETCKQNFAFNNLLKYHQQQHRHGVFASKPETRFECKSCVRSFATKAGLRHHQNNSHAMMKLHCDLCDKIFKTNFLIRQHMKSHIRLPCPICQRMFAKRFLKSHVDQHSSSGNLKCDVCKKVYSTMHVLNLHKKKYHEIDDVQCDLCGKMFLNKILLRDHMKHHLKVPCPICKKLKRKADMKIHMKSSHSSGEKFLACVIAKCQQKFKNIEELKEHKKIHIGPGIYKCPKCDYRTNKINKIKRHLISRVLKT